MDVSVTDGRHYAFESFVLDPLHRTLTYRRSPVAISPTLFDALLYLVEHPRRVVSKDELMEAVWQGRAVEESNIKQTIFTLRAALTAACGEQNFIQTAPGRGYRFVVPVEIQSWKSGQIEHAHWAYETSPPRMDRTLSPKPGVPLRYLAILGAVAGIATVGAAAWYWRGPHDAPPQNLVVLADFQNLTKDPLFDKSLAQAVEIELVQSPAITLLPDKKVRDTLGLMTLPEDAPRTLDLAQEVCARNNGQTALAGGIASVGDHYLLTLTATDCVEGQILAAEKAEVATKDALLPALDAMVARVRRRLGESRASIARLGAPMLARRTVSLEALQAYSQGHDLFDHGKRIEAIPFFKRAIELDPNFADAYSELARIYSNIHERGLSVQYATQSYNLKDHASKLEQLQISFTYASYVSKDALEKIRILQELTELYPNDETAWSNLSDSENWVSQYAAAVEAGKRAVALPPAAEASYAVLSRAYMHLGRFKEAIATCTAAVAKHLDGDDIHNQLLAMAYFRQDQAGAAREIAWAKGKPGESTLIITEGLEAFRTGQVRQALATFAQMEVLGAANGLPDFTAAPNARLLNDLGLPDRARQLLAKVPAGFDSADYRFALAELGDPKQAQALLKADLAQSPSDTLLNDVSAPEVNAALALRRNDPRAAIRALEPAAPYELRTYDIPYLRGLADLAASDGAQAAIDFHKILDNPGIEPASPLYSLAHLGLARALRLQHDRPGSRAAYDAFFADWKSADPDLPLMHAARAEYASL